MYCDLLLARFGLIQDLSQLDDGLEEAVSGILWVEPYLSVNVKELKIIANILTAKYGKEFARVRRENLYKTVDQKLISKLNIVTPSSNLVEKYLCGKFWIGRIKFSIYFFLT